MTCDFWTSYSYYSCDKDTIIVTPDLIFVGEVKILDIIKGHISRFTHLKKLIKI